MKKVWVVAFLALATGFVAFTTTYVEKTTRDEQRRTDQDHYEYCWNNYMRDAKTSEGVRVCIDGRGHSVTYVAK